MPKPCSAATVLWKCARTLESGFGVSLPFAESLAVRYCHSLEARAMDFRLSKAQQNKVPLFLGLKARSVPI